AAAAERGINVWADGPAHVQVSTSETTTPEHVAAVVEAFVAVLSDLPEDCCGGGCCDGPRAAAEARDGSSDVTVTELPASLLRTSEYLTHPVFRTHRSETAMMRYLRRLADRDLALDRTMIPLGSCTMKLNPAAAMEPISWPEFADLHPFVPAEQAAGSIELIDQLADWLARITGYAKVSVQPNAGSQGELAGLLAIRSYHRAQGHGERDVCLIPASAHGTNASSAALAGLRVVVVATHSSGGVDLDDLRAKLAAHEGRVAAIMITYPSSHGVFEEHVREVCGLVHDAGGQVYTDGAHLNALVGRARPGRFGGDVSHLNLHKTFCIPHGGGGPGVGPVAVAEHLVDFLPTTALPGAPATPPDDDAPDDDAPADDAPSSAPRISAAPYGSAGILQIPWAYIATMGADGLTEATKVAVLTGNYLATRLREHFPILYTGPNGLVAHECILDLRPLTKATGVTAEDVAKRLMDFGFHAPTLSFPVAGTLMVEPTESEDLAELDRFVEAMVAIKSEIDAVAAGTYPVEDSPLRHAPHTARAVTASSWDRPY